MRGVIPALWIAVAVIAAIVVGADIYVAEHSSAQTAQPTTGYGYRGPHGPGAGVNAGVNAGVSQPAQTSVQAGVTSEGSITEPLIEQIATLPKQSLNPEEINAIEEMRQEEKLARDVYLTLYQKWGLPIFQNIARSEQTHMDAVKALIDKYGLPDPDANMGIGEFRDEKFRKLYEELVAEGSKSVVDALKVGATIEDLDIKDLQYWLSKTDNEDIKLAFCNLMKGSRNHLRAFVSQLQRYGATYTPQYISEQEFNAIISGSQEMGVVQCQ